VEVQRQIEARNDPVPTRDKIRLRIGINVADILIDEIDIAGGGVNLAARLETLAQPGGICISQALKEQIQEDLGIDYVDCGTRRVKNISRPVRVFQVISGHRPALTVLRMRLQGMLVSSKWPWAVTGVAVLAFCILATMRWFQPAATEEVEKLSITVLPFKSTSSELATQELASRLQGQLLMALSPESHLLRVKGLASGAQPSDSWDVRRVRSELKARYAVVGDVSRVAGVQKVNARLLDTTTGAVVWGDTFEIPSHLEHVATEIITKRLVAALPGTIVGLETERVRQSPPARPDSMDLVLLGDAELMVETTAESLKRADGFYKRALDLDPQNVPALASRAWVVFYRGPLAAASDPPSLLRAEQLTRAAVALDPNCANSWVLRSQVLADMGQREAAFAAVDRASRINPANPGVALARAALLVSDGRSREVIQPLDELKLLYEKGPLASFVGIQCMARIYAKRLDDAPPACDSWYGMGAGVPAARALVALYGLNGETEKAARAKSELLRLDPNASIGAIKVARAHLVNESAVFVAQREETYYRGLKLAGIPD
jgi:adenylate cyclase